MRHTSDLIEASVELNTAIDVLKVTFYRGADEALSKNIDNFGSSTACVAMINKDNGYLEFANLVDSKVVCLSPYKDGDYVINRKSEPHQNGFNNLIQYTLRSDGFMIDNGHKIDSKKCISVRSGDAILVMTNGVVMKNVFEAELNVLVTEALNKSRDDARGLKRLLSKRSNIQKIKNVSVPLLSKLKKKQRRNTLVVKRMILLSSQSSLNK